MDEVRLRDVPERVVLVERRAILVSEVRAYIEEALARHRALLDEAGASAAGPPYVAFAGPVTDEVRGPVEVCTPVAGELAARSDLPLRREPAHREAFTTVPKWEARYPEILQAYALVEVWAGEAGLVLIGPPRQVRLADAAEAGDDDPVLDVAQPVR
jgi:hypothetical protein